MVEYSQKCHNGTSLKARSTKTSNGLASIQAQINNLGREIRKSTKKYMLLRSNANYAKDNTTQRIVHSRKKGKLLKKLTTHTLEHPINLEDNIKQQGQDSTKATTEILRTQTEDKFGGIVDKFMAESAKRHKENSNIIKEIQASTDASIRNQGASIKTMEIQIEHSKEEETTSIMMEKMEQRMSKTRGNYGSRVFRPKINNKTHFELKGKFLKELCEILAAVQNMKTQMNTSKKSLRSLTYFISPRSNANYAKDNTTQRIVHSRKKGKLLKKLTTHTLEHPINLEDNIKQQGQDSTKATTEILRTQTEDKFGGIVDKFMAESAKRHKENSNIIKEIQASTDASIRNQGASIKTMEIQIG
uniref:Uncharacterized protein n=1 Tax=Tanacetum cinerariifolium TaxID=118510 RepID=A0A6L2LLE1_TANCI|nr:hypothetical protein [Tanacetum cinerariifolium]